MNRIFDIFFAYNFEIIVNSTGLRLSDILDNGFNTIICESMGLS